MVPSKGGGGAGATGGRPARAAAADTIARSAAECVSPSSAACWNSGEVGAKSGAGRTAVKTSEPTFSLRRRHRINA